MYIFSGLFWLHTLTVCKDEQSHPLVCRFPFGSLVVGFYCWPGTIASGPFWNCKIPYWDLWALPVVSSNWSLIAACGPSTRRQHLAESSKGSCEVSQNFWRCILLNKRLCELCIAVKRTNQICCWMRDPAGHHLLLFHCSNANQFWPRGFLHRS